MRSYRQYVSVIACVLVLAAGVLPSLVPAEKASALFTTSVENRSPLSTDNVTHKKRPPKPEHFAGLTSSAHPGMEGLSGLDPALLAGKNEKPEIHTAAYGSLEFVYVDAATGNDSYDGSSPVVLPGGVGPKKTIQAGIDAADYYCVVFVAAGVYRENLIIVDYYMDLVGMGGARTTIIDGGESGQVMYIDECDIWIEGFTIRNGYSSVIGGGAQIEDSEVYFAACAIKDNYALGGGGVFNWYSATIFYESAITNNSALHQGGGIANVEGVIALVNSTVSNNTATGSDWGGGGIYSYGSGMWLGGIELYGSTLAHNSAPAAGASGGGYYNHQYSVSFFESSIVANNTAGTPGTNNAFANGLSFSDGYNIDSENTCGFIDATDQVNTDPRLGPLKDNGGPTDTHAITADSPAFERGYCDELCWCDFIDQRGVTRPQGIYCDVGAYELVMNRNATATAANYGGQVNFSASGGGIVDLVVTSKCPGSGSWSGATFPYGFFSFKIVGITPGATVQVTITFPGPIPAEYRYMQCDGSGHWTDITSLVSRTNAANTLVLTLTDGGPGDLDHTANGRIVDPAGPCLMPVQRSPSSASSSSVQQPVALPSVKVQSASLSSSSVAPGTAVNVIADVVNTGTVNGSMTVKLYINGQEEDSRVIVVEKGTAVPVAFEVMRNEPGTYSVYVGGVNAGSFIVDSYAGPEVILIISSVMLFTAFMIGVIYIYRRRQLL